MGYPTAAVERLPREVLVESIADASEGVRLFVVRASDERPLPAWKPGAHLHLRLPNGLQRQYSLCGDPANRWVWQFAVLREARGRGGSTYLHDEVRVGSRLVVTEIRNDFKLVDAERYTFIAGGIGITPLLPMIAEVACSGRPWRLVYGGRTTAAMAFRRELGVHDHHVRFVPEDTGGRLDIASILAEVQTEEVVYCCGPSGLLDAVQVLIGPELRSNLYVERFAAGEITTDEKEFDVELKRTGGSVHVGPRETIVDALRREGIDVETSCETGICSTCEIRVVCGAVDHRDEVLSASEKEASRSMMICVSRATGDRIVLDM